MAAKFEVGQLVHHLRYDYRGVVFDVDEECRAEENWYHSNQTQPARDQPWYHVLVHGAEHTTYVAESNLETDAVGGPVKHPMVDRIFQSFTEGRYHVESQN
jgi:heat shock protein HspQ